MDSHKINDPISESVEMYLLRIALLQDDDRPVPISALAEGLSVSPVSANQMCRKLEERGLVAYEPYKGVTLTLQGEAVAMRVLRKRRLWEVFLADRLGLEPSLAEDIACRFEHVTPDGLVERLASFLGNPTLSPQQEPIPLSIGAAVRRPRLPLTSAVPGQLVQVIQVDIEGTGHEFLRSQGLAPGDTVKALAVAAGGSMLIETGDGELALASDLARLIYVAPASKAPLSPSPSPDLIENDGSAI